MPGLERQTQNSVEGREAKILPAGKISREAMHTTYITGTITSTIIGITHRFRSIFMQNESKNEQKNQNQDKDRQQIGFQSGVWLVYMIAAALAAVAETRLPAVAAFLPLASSILVLLTAILYQLA
jgi:uncharacterized membrane protein YoaK (UPF0700 family)